MLITIYYFLINTNSLASIFWSENIISNKSCILSNRSSTEFDGIIGYWDGLSIIFVISDLLTLNLVAKDCNKACSSSEIYPSVIAMEAIDAKWALFLVWWPFLNNS